MTADHHDCPVGAARPTSTTTAACRHRANVLATPTPIPLSHKGKSFRRRMIKGQNGSRIALTNPTPSPISHLGEVIDLSTSVPPPEPHVSGSTPRRNPSLTPTEIYEIRHALGFHFDERHHPTCLRELTIQADAIEVIVTRILARREFAADAQDFLATLDREA